jgi:Kef-type K+ transport system membrane component KefB
MESARLLPATFAGSTVISFTGLLIVGVVAVAVPLLLGLVPAVKVPAVVLEILGGILVGPAVLGWVHLDVAVRVTSDLGLGFLLFMAGFEIDLRRFDRRVLNLVGRAFVLSAVLALLFAYGLRLGGEVRDGLLVGITLMATSLGVLVPILKDADQTQTYFGRLIMAAGSLAELAPLVLLSVFFSASSTNPSVELGLLAAFVGFTALVVVVTQRVRAWVRCGRWCSDWRTQAPSCGSGWLSRSRWPSRWWPNTSGWPRSWGHSWPGSSCAGPTSRRPRRRNSRASWKRSALGS